MTAERSDAMNFKNFLEQVKSGDYEALIFDLDGTLIDSMSMWTEVDKKFLEQRGLKLTDEYTRTVKCSTLMQSALFTINYYGLDETPEHVIECWESMVKEKYRTEVKVKDGAQIFLEKLSKLDVYMVCATALSRENAVNALIGNDIMKFFDRVITLDELEQKVNKGNPLIYETACREHGIGDFSRCVVFEDILIALEGASKSGFKLCAVYDELSSSEWDKMCDISDYCIRNWSEIKKIC